VYAVFSIDGCLPECIVVEVPVSWLRVRRKVDENGTCQAVTDVVACVPLMHLPLVTTARAFSAGITMGRQQWQCLGRHCLHNSESAL
jgi:hypothetical protein